MKISKEEKEFIEDYYANIEFEKSKERFLNSHVFIEDVFEEKTKSWNQEKYLKNLNEKHNQRNHRVGFFPF